MKNKFFLVATLIFGAALLSSYTTKGTIDNNVTDPSISVTDSHSSIVFRSTQKLRARDGGEIYFYSNGKCEMYQNDRLVVSCTYTIGDNEVKLLDEYGNTVYKGRISWDKTKTKAMSVTIAGTTYYKVN